MRRILVTGAAGQIGSELVPALRSRYGADQVIATDVRFKPMAEREGEGPVKHLDCMQLPQLQGIIRRYDIGTIYHLASLLSAAAEERPQTAWEVNMGSLYAVLESARQYGCAVFFPSSVGAFGPSTPREGAPQETVQRPTTIYGVTKVASELLCDYYAHRFGVDARGLRLPGLISHATPPGGGTTDYAVEIFYQAVLHGRYTCFLRYDTRLDMLYMPDAIDGMIRLMEADVSRLKHHNAFNVTAMNFTPEQLATEIRKHLPAFRIAYEVDPLRQAIADSWPNSMDDSAARTEWGWAPCYNISSMTKEMLDNLCVKLKGPA